MGEHQTPDKSEDKLSPSMDKESSFSPYCTSLIIGLIAGALAFSIIFHFIYTATLSRIELQHNATLQLFQDRVDMTIQEKQQCLDDDSETLEVAELRGTLAAQADFKEKYKELEVEFGKQREQMVEMQRRLREMEDREADYENELEAHGLRLQELKEETVAREREYFEQREIIDRQTSELEIVTKERNLLQERTTRLTDQRSALNKQVKEFSRRIDEIGRQTGKSEIKVNQLQRRVQQREAFLCKEDYGNGPYYVQVVTKPQTEDASTSYSFVIELASRKDMPHSVFTFLSLVSYQMYHNTLFRKSHGDDVLTLAMAEDVQQGFNVKRRAVGMEEGILMFTESSAQFPCEEYTVGFIGHGPMLEFHTGPVGSKNEQSCFGKVVRGIEDLTSILKLVAGGMTIDIAKVELLIL